MLVECSYRCNSIGSIWSRGPIGLPLLWRSRGSRPSYHGRHVCCSLPSVDSDSEGSDEEQGSKFKIEDDDETNALETMEDEEIRGGSASERRRAKPKNPRLRIGKTTLQDFTKRLEDRLQAYEEDSKPALLFTSEERYALNRVRPDLEKLSSEKWPLLHTLAISGDSIYLDRLLRQDADVNVLDKDGYSALQRAVLARKETIVNQLLRAQADATIRDNGGATLLHYSVQTGSMNLVRSFLHFGVDVNSADKYGWTPLHLAVLTGRADIVRLLLISGADKTLTNKDGLTALDLCFSLGRGFNSIEVAKGLKRFPKERPTISMT